MSTSVQAQIIKAITDTVRKIQCPDKTNKGTLMFEAYLWDMIEAYAKKKSKEAWDNIEKAELYDIADAGESAGTTCLAKSTHFVINCTMSNPVRRFSPDWLAKTLKTKYKIPEPVGKQLCEEAKQPTKPNKSISVVEVATSS